MISFQRERVGDVMSEAIPLLIKEHREIARFQDIKLNPDWEGYVQADVAGQIAFFTAREAGVFDRRLLGYQLFWVRPHHHFLDSLTAYQDILFIDPEHRGFGYEFLKWCDRELKAQGVQVVFQYVNSQHDFSPMLKRQGYELIDYVFAKRLDKMPTL